MNQTLLQFADALSLCGDRRYRVCRRGPYFCRYCRGPNPPRMRAVALGAAITPLLWIHAFRYVALQLFSAQAFGFAIPDRTRDQIVYGDLIGMVLALATLYALRSRWRFAIPLAWVFVVATVLDLSNAAVMGIREHLFDKATDVSWLILTFYVPALWVSVALVAWRLWTRRDERLANS